MFQRCKIYFLGFLITLLPLVSLAAVGQTLFGKVIRVVDGDTVAFKVHNGPVEKIRLADIDTPERDQPWGTEATTALRQWSMAKPARIDVVDTDRYGRLVATLWIDDKNINRRLVEDGHAWVYRRYLRDNLLIKLEAIAKSNKTGLWSSKTAIKPSDWRRGERSSEPLTIVSQGASGPVKKSKSGICHESSSTYYARILHFKPFTTLDSCLASGGRLPKR